MIVQSPDSLSLSGNLKPFRVHSADIVSFILKDGDTVLLEAAYVPGTDGRVTINVRDIVESRLSFVISNENFYQQPNVVKTFTAVIDGTEYTFRAIRSGVANLSDTPANWLKGNFLTWQPTQKEVSYYSPEWLTYYAVEAATLKLKAYFNDGTNQLVNIGNLIAGNAYTANLQYAVVAGLLGQMYPSYYEVWAETAGGTRLTYIQQYLYSEPKSEQEQWFLFENSLGGIDTLRAYGDTDFDGAHTHKIATVNNTSFEYDIDTKRNYNKNTGHLDEYERRWLLDFFPSKAKFLHYAAAIRPIVVVDDNVKYSASDLPSSYSFKYRFADDSTALLNLIRNEDAIPADIVIPDITSPDFILPPRLSEYPRVTLSEGVILPVFDPHSSTPKATSFGAISRAIIEEALWQVPGAGEGGSMVQVLGEDSILETTNKNVFSSLRVLKEIATKISAFATAISLKFLRKDKADSASEVITFLKGIIASGTSQFVDLIVSGKVIAEDIDVNDTLQTDILRVITQATLQDAILKGQLNSETFVSGFLGEGFRLKKENGRWVLEIDDLVVRKTMQVYELVVQKVRYQGGQVLHSPAGGKLTAVTDGGTYWRCEHDSPDDFDTDDFVLCQAFKVGSRAQNPDGSTVFQGAKVKRYWRKVTSFGPGWFNLSKTDMESGSDVPEAGDEVATLGNKTKSERQNAILIASTGSNTPYLAHYAGINSYSLAGKEVVREGNLFGVVDAVFGQLSGYGLYSNNVFLRGIFKLVNGTDVGQKLAEHDTTFLSTATKEEVSTAKTEAISAAALDATNKANTAQTNATNTAKGYTDGQIAPLAQTVATHTTSIAQNAQEISLRATKAEAQGYVDSLQIGGGNLLSASDWEQGTGAPASAAGTSYEALKYASTTRIRTKNLVEINGSCALSISNLNYRYLVYLFDANRGYLGQANGEIVWRQEVIILPESTKYIAVLISKVNNSAISVSEFSDAKLKLERGNKATDYSEAPKDVRAYTDMVRADMSAALTVQAGLIASKVSQTEFNWLGARVSSTESQISQHAIQISAKVGLTEVESAIQNFKRTVKHVDIRNLEQNTYYPVTIKCGSAVNPIEIFVWSDLAPIYGVPSWALHASGFSLFCRWRTNGSGWGAINIDREILQYEQGFVSGYTIGDIGQMSNSSNEFFYLRGGGYYIIEVAGNSNIEITLHTGTFTVYNESVAPKSSISPPTTTRNNIFATGIDIANKRITLTANNTRIQDNAGQTIALFNANGTKIRSAAIELEGIVTANQNFKILADGSVEAKNGKFTGRIESTTGKIGGFDIGGNYIGTGQGQGGGVSGMSLWDDFIVFNKANQQAFIGATSVMGVRVLGRFADTQVTDLPKTGVLFEVSGSSDSESDTAISLKAGHIAGLTVRCRRITSSTTLTRADVFVSCYFSVNGHTITFPANPEQGEIKIIFNINNKNITLNGNGKQFLQGGPTTHTNPAIGPAHSLGGNYMFLYDGQYWIIMSM